MYHTFKGTLSILYWNPDHELSHFFLHFNGNHQEFACCIIVRAHSMELEKQKESYELWKRIFPRLPNLFIFYYILSANVHCFQHVTYTLKC